MRTQIIKHLKTRSEAIKAAVGAYNKVAKSMGRDALDEEDVLNYTYIGQFDILRDTRNQIMEKPWAKPTNRIARDAWFKSKRAAEEIIRVEVEVARLRSWMDKEEAIYVKVIEEQLPISQPLAYELKTRLALVRQAHSRIRRDLERIPSITGYKAGFSYESVSNMRVVGNETDADADEDYEAEEVANNEFDNLDEGLARAERLG